MKSINAIKIGNVVNVNIDGRFYKKNCGTPEEANNLFKLVLTARENPNQDNLKNVIAILNEKIRVALKTGLEHDPETGNIFLAGFNTPIPQNLVEVIDDYYENNHPLSAIINFWKLLMINPDKTIRVRLFDFIKTHDFVLTSKGYMIVYKAVYRKDNEMNPDAIKFAEFVSNQVLKVRKEWKCSPNKYVVYRNDEGEYNITKTQTANSWNVDDKNVEILGKLGDLFNSIYNVEDDILTDNVPVYTDMHTRTMDIVLGVPVKMDRTECDSDPAIDCSYGLHVGATKYVQTYANKDSVVMVCLVNPAHVVAVPNYDHSKMRVSEYFPYALATYENREIDIIEEKYFEDDYCAYEQKEFEALIAKVRENELPIQTAINAKEEDRQMSELMKMLESRLIDIT